MPWELGCQGKSSEYWAGTERVMESGGASSRDMGKAWDTGMCLKHKMAKNGKDMRHGNVPTGKNGKDRNVPTGKNGKDMRHRNVPTGKHGKDRNVPTGKNGKDMRHRNVPTGKHGKGMRCVQCAYRKKWVRHEIWQCAYRQTPYYWPLLDTAQQVPPWHWTVGIESLECRRSLLCARESWRTQQQSVHDMGKCKHSAAWRIMICSMITCQKQTSNVMLWSYSSITVWLLWEISQISPFLFYTHLGSIHLTTSPSSNTYTHTHILVCLCTNPLILPSTSQPVHPVTHTHTHICLSACVLIHTSTPQKQTSAMPSGRLRIKDSAAPRLASNLSTSSVLSKPWVREIINQHSSSKDK